MTTFEIVNKYQDGTLFNLSELELGSVQQDLDTLAHMMDLYNLQHVGEGSAPLPDDPVISRQQLIEISQSIAQNLTLRYGSDD